MSNRTIICGIVCGVCWLLVALIVALMSIGTVEPIEYGISYNAITKSINKDKVYQGGWYFIGPFNSFITFPATAVNIDFSEYEGAQQKPLEVKDSEGQNIKLSFSIQYRLDMKELISIYENFQKGYEPRFYDFIQNAVASQVGIFKQDAFWNNRFINSETLRKATADALAKQHAIVTGLQIINVQLNAVREDSLIKTQVTTQQKETKIREQRAQAIRADINVTSSNSEKNITTIIGEAQAATKLIQAQSQALAKKKVIGAEAEAYNILGNTTGFLPENGLDKYILLQDQQTSESADMFFYVSQGMIKMRP